eukprot:gene8058-10916_t
MFKRQQTCRQSIPINDRLPFITNHNLPMIILLVQIALRLCGIHSLTMDLPFTCVALLFSWSYLRFYFRYGELQQQPIIFGEKADEFSFVNMFPEQLHIIVIPFTTAFYNIIAMIGLYPPLEVTPERKTPQHHLRYADPILPEAETHSISPKPNKVADRRRAKAMKLLDAKLAELNKSGIAGEDWDEELVESETMEDGNVNNIRSFGINLEQSKVKI